MRLSFKSSRLSYTWLSLALVQLVSKCIMRYNSEGIMSTILSRLGRCRLYSSSLVVKLFLDVEVPKRLYSYLTSPLSANKGVTGEYHVRNYCNLSTSLWLLSYHQVGGASLCLYRNVVSVGLAGHRCTGRTIRSPAYFWTSRSPSTPFTTRSPPYWRTRRSPL